MSDILHPPSTVLLAGVNDEYVENARDGLLDGTTSTVRTADEPASTMAAVGDDDDVACVVVGSDLPAEKRRELCSSLDSLAPDLPVIVAVDDDASLIRAVLRAGATDVVEPDSPIPEFRSLVEDRVADYRRRRVHAEESEVLTTMLEDLGKSIYVKDEEARIVHIADVPGGFDPENARGKTDVELYGEDDPVAAKEAYQDDRRVIEEGVKVIDRDEHVDPEDEDLWMRTTKIPWTDDDGDVRGLIGLTFDVTDLKHTELQLEDLGRRFETFTSRLDHDVKSPLQVASGYLDIARETGDPGALDKVEEALERIDEIVDDYRVLNDGAARVDDQTPVEFRETVEDIWSALDSGDAELDVDAEDVRINATDGMIRPVLENLLRNAVTHAGDDVVIRAGLTDDGFYVEDTGTGIPEAKREKVLEPGYTTSSDGSGRGLSIVTDEMAEHVWSLDIDESDEGGARFEVANCRFDVVGNPDGDAVTVDEEATVGTLEEPGSAEYDAELGRWTVVSDGTDVFRSNNDFYFVYATVEGPVSIRGEVAHVDHLDDYSKGGLMIRDTVDQDAAYGYVGKTPTHGSELLWRDRSGVDGLSEQLEEKEFTFDQYRLDREGDDVRMYLSMDGEHWQQVGHRTVSLSDPVHVGMVACSCRPGQQIEAVFEDVSITKPQKESGFET